MGDTKAGKSTVSGFVAKTLNSYADNIHVKFINLLLKQMGDGRRVKVEDQLVPCTNELQPIVIGDQIARLAPSFMNLSDENRIVLVDTPGFDDDIAADLSILKRIASWIQESSVPHSLIILVATLNTLLQAQAKNAARRCYIPSRHLP